MLGRGARRPIGGRPQPLGDEESGQPGEQEQALAEQQGGGGGDHVEDMGPACRRPESSAGRRAAPERHPPIAITAETDRVYLNTTGVVDVKDAGLKRTLRVSKSGSNSTIVWNPWIDKAKKMADFGDEEWPGMLCIETANAHDNRVTVAPGTTHSIGTEVAVLPL